MKKRLLALCLAAALLLGMMPALTMPAKAVEPGKQSLVMDPNAEGYNLSLVHDGYKYFWNGTYWDLRTMRGSPEVSWTMPAVLDHSHNVQIDLRLNEYTENDADASDGSITVGEDGAITARGWFMKITDTDANGGVIFVNRYFDGVTNKVRVLLPNGNCSDPIDLGVSGNIGSTVYSVVWNANGSVSVLYAGKKLGTVANATWTHEQVAARNIVAATADGIETTYNYVYSASPGGTTRTARAFLTSVDVTHNGVYATEMDGVFTTEAITVDGALTESDWSKASFVDLECIKTAVLVNKGNAYVALKGADGEVSVKLGNATQTATIANGVAEVVFENAVKAYGATAELNVGIAKANLTFAPNKLLNEGAMESVTTSLVANALNYAVYELGNAPSSVNNANYVRLYSDKTKSADGFEVFLDLDHTKPVKLNQFVSMDQNGAKSTAGISLENGELSYNGALIRIADVDGEGAVLYIQVGIDASGKPVFTYLTPNRNTVPLAFNNNTHTGQVIDWHTDGSVTMTRLISASSMATYATNENVTWTLAQVEAAGLEVPVHDGYKVTVDGTGLESGYVQAYWYHSATTGFGANGAAVMSTGGITVTHPNYVGSFTPDLKTELAPAIEAVVDTDKLVSVPATVVHPYLGEVALTWSDSEGLIVDGAVTVPDDDTVTNLTAKVGGEVVWGPVEAAVMAAERVMGMFALDVDTAWPAANFLPMTGAGSVAALASDKDTVYIAVKSADASATVVLGEAEQTIDIVDGMGVAVFENVALAFYGDNRTIKVTTASGSLDTKVIFKAQKADVAYYDLYKNYSNVSIVGGAWQQINVRFQMNSTDSRKFGSIKVTQAVDLSRYFLVEQNINLFPEKTVATKNEGNFTVTDNNVSAFGQRITVQDYDSGKHVFANIYVDAENNRYVRFFLPANGGTNSDAILLGYPDAWVNVGFGIDADGSVTVFAEGNAVAKVDDAVWTTDKSAKVGTAQNPYGADMYESYTLLNDDLNHTSGTWGYSRIGSIAFYPCVMDIDVPAVGEYAYSLDLGSDIGFNFYIPELPGATITVNAAGVEKVYTGSDALLLKEGKYAGKYLVEGNVAAAQMTEDVRLTVVDAYGFILFDKPTSVKNYSEQILGKEEYSAEAKELVNKMLVYGGAAQRYFNYNTSGDGMVSNAAPSEALLNVDGTYTAKVDGELEGIKAKSATLILEKKVTIRYYFTAETVEDFTFKCGEETLTPEQKSVGVWYVDVEVNPQNMGTEYTVSVNNTLNVTYSCMTYMTKFVKNAKEAELMKAMYDYYKAAESYEP